MIWGYDMYGKHISIYIYMYVLSYIGSMSIMSMIIFRSLENLVIEEKLGFPWKSADSRGFCLRPVKSKVMVA